MSGYRFLLESRRRMPAPPPPLEITVVAATAEEVATTLTALGQLWHGLNATVKVLLPVVVQFPAQLTEPPVSPGFLERQLRSAVAGHTAARTEVTILLCRDATEAIREALKPHSLVVVARRKWGSRVPWAPLTRALEKAGHSVVFSR